MIDHILLSKDATFEATVDMTVQEHIFLLAGILLSALSCVKTPAYNLEDYAAPTVSNVSAESSASEIGISLTSMISRTNTVKSCGFRWGRDEQSMSNDLVGTISDKGISSTLETKDYGKTLYVQPYISNGMDVVTGKTTSFTVPSFDEYVKIAEPSVTVAQDGTVKVSAAITAATGINITEKGIRYGESESQLTKTIKCGSGNESIDDVSIPGLTLGKTYYVCAYADEYSDEAVSKVVVTKIQKVTGVSLNKSSLSMGAGEKETLVATISPDDAVNKSVKWSSDNIEVAMVDQNGNVSAISEGTAVISVTTVDGCFTAQCMVSVEDKVDLGLSVRWASCNVGASKPEEYGTYFAWGDVVGQTWSGSSWSGGGFPVRPVTE